MPVEKVSYRKGNNVKKAPKHQNITAFKHNPNSKLTTKIESLPVNGLCVRCVNIVHWRKKYRKYKPLTVPKKCTRCHEKAVRDAYHILCRDCAQSLHVCEKCQDPIDNNAILTTKEQENIYLQEEEELLKYLSERQRRTYQRRRAEILPEDTPITLEIIDVLRKLLDNVSFGIIKADGDLDDAEKENTTCCEVEQDQDSCSECSNDSGTNSDGDSSFSEESADS